MKKEIKVQTAKQLGSDVANLIESAVNGKLHKKKPNSQIVNGFKVIKAGYVYDFKILPSGGNMRIAFKREGMHKGRERFMNHGTTDEMLLQMLMHRFRHLDKNNSHTPALVHLGAALDCLKQVENDQLKPKSNK